jgi:hypothetical protein
MKWKGKKRKRNSKEKDKKKEEKPIKSKENIKKEEKKGGVRINKSVVWGLTLRLPTRYTNHHPI